MDLAFESEWACVLGWGPEDVSILVLMDLAFECIGRIQERTLSHRFQSLF